MPAMVLRSSCCQCRLSVQEWEITQILAILLDQVEGVEDRGSGGLTTGQLLEPRHAVRPKHNRLAVDREALGLDTRRSSGNGCQSRRPIIGIAAVKSSRWNRPGER
jgi:hypothetical protein